MYCMYNLANGAADQKRRIARDAAKTPEGTRSEDRKAARAARKL